MKMTVLSYIFFSKDKINSLLEGYQNIKIEDFEEGSFPRKLHMVINKKKWTS